MFNLELQTAKAGFFDRPKVINATDRATVRNLSRFGAFVRTRSRSSIRQRRAISDPGNPPSSHVGTLRELILFSYDAGRRSVVIGPTLLRAGSRVPITLEEGGEETILSRGKEQVMHVQARPFMHPAFDLELSKLDPLWRDSVR